MSRMSEGEMIAILGRIMIEFVEPEVAALWLVQNYGKKEAERFGEELDRLDRIGMFRVVTEEDN